MIHSRMHEEVFFDDKGYNIGELTSETAHRLFDSICHLGTTDVRWGHRSSGHYVLIHDTNCALVALLSKALTSPALKDMTVEEIVRAILGLQ